MNQKYFLAVMSIRIHANKINKRVKSVVMEDDTGLFYVVNYWGDCFQEFRISSVNADIVYISKMNCTKENE